MNKRQSNDMPAEYYDVLNCIINAPDKYITRGKILMQLGKEQSYTRKLVDIIHGLIVDYDCPIGASAVKGKLGYFIIKSKEDKALAVKTLTSRISGIKKRADKLQNIKL